MSIGGTGVDVTDGIRGARCWSPCQNFRNFVHPTLYVFQKRAVGLLLVFVAVVILFNTIDTLHNKLV